MSLLGRSGLISRDPDPADRRSHLGSITFARRKRRATARAAVRSMKSAFLADLNQRERAALPSLLPQTFVSAADLDA